MCDLHDDTGNMTYAVDTDISKRTIYEYIGVRELSITIESLSKYYGKPFRYFYCVVQIISKYHNKRG